MREIVLVLDGIRSVHNVGSVFRTADAAGVKRIYLCGITPTPLDRFGKPRQDLKKVSLGAEATVQWEKRDATKSVLGELKKAGYKIFAVEQDKKSVPYYKSGIKGKKIKIALVLGNEVKGVSNAVLKECDKILEIPMHGAMIRDAHHARRTGLGKESLNVGVTAGIVLFEFVNY